MFTLGLISVIDALSETPMRELHAKLPLAPDICESLVEHKGRQGELLERLNALEDKDLEKAEKDPADRWPAVQLRARVGSRGHRARHSDADTPRGDRSAPIRAEYFQAERGGGCRVGGPPAAPVVPWGLRPQNARARGSVGVASWPCGRNTQPKSESHQRRYLRYEASGVGHWF